MALGDINLDANTPSSAGNYVRVTGTIEASSTATEFAIASSRWIVNANVVNIDDDDTTIRVVINSDDGTEGSQKGSIYVQTSSADVDTLRFELLVV